ncbi:TetR family transcriptional regulator [Massilia sp. HP4]|uniref:TetR family transcriptional regulator n=1 Tax=Massilia sp. HP4 TaxID=2562316 RepID=UPI0010C05A85|nr:TetR family transcriptional regulator [Massilia sp. HP4]
MARTKTLPDLAVLDQAVALMHGSGPDHLTFASLAAATGLSGATLVQRFTTKAGLRQRTLLHAWELLERRSAQLIGAMERTPSGARRLLVDLSRDYGGIEAYAQGLLLLREDLRDPLLRERGAAWGRTLVAALDACFVGTPGAPDGIGRFMASQWQGALLWWAFDPVRPVHEFVDDELARFAALFKGQCPELEVR